MTPDVLATLTRQPLDLIDVDPDSGSSSPWAGILVGHSASPIIPQQSSGSASPTSASASVTASAPITAPYSRVCEKSPTKAHHWVIAPPDGVPSEGVCIHCNVSRFFRNSMEFVWKTVPGATVPANSGRGY